MTASFQQFPMPARDQRLALVAAFAEEAGCCFLDSSEADHPNSRFEILGIRPLWSTRRRAMRNSDPLELLSEQMLRLSEQFISEQVLEAETLSHLPFIGGLLFALGYDLGRCYESLEDNIEPDFDAECGTP